MPMTDGNPDTKPVQATLSPDAAAAIGLSVAQAVTQLQKQNAASEPKESRFQSKIKSLLSTGTVDKDNLAEITALQQAAIDDLEEKLVSKYSDTTIQSAQSRYAEAVADALEKYIEGDDSLEESAELLQHKALKKLSADPSVMAKFNAGQLDKRSINTIAKEVVEEFSKKVLKRDKTSKGPAMNTGVSSTVASNAIENSGPAGSIDDITEPHRREAFLKLKGIGQRWGKMTPEASEAWAYKHATRQYKKGGTAA
jgi:hypothetical protein